MVAPKKCVEPRLFLEDRMECNKCKVTRKVAPVVKCRKCCNYVNEGGIFYRYDKEGNRSWKMCNSCFKAERVEITVSVFDNNNNNSGKGSCPVLIPRRVKKTEFLRATNIATEPEPTVTCMNCCKTFHRICVKCVVLKSRVKGEYVCNSCRRNLPNSHGYDNSLQNLAKAKDLSETDLSRFIEDRVNKMLPKDTKYIYVRVLSCTDKIYTLDDSLRKFLRAYYNAPRGFNYRNRMIACFQNVEHDDTVMFFVVYLQEYGPDCPEPNKNSININLLDSAQIFEPRNMRRKVYHGVLLTYLSYMKDQGFEHAYLWSCPPITPEVEYIFQRRPGTQQHLSVTRLHLWYKQMMTAGVSLDIVEDFKLLYDLLPKTENEFFKKLPLFQDDHWPGEILEIVNKVKSGEYVRPPPNKKPKKNGVNIPENSENDEANMNSHVYMIVKRRMQDERNNFRYMRLKADGGGSSSEIGSVDPIISSKLMNSRENLINCLLINRLEFQDLRKAVYATKTTLLQLLIETPEIICNDCSDAINPWGYNHNCYNNHICRKCRGKLQYDNLAKKDFKEIMPSFNKIVREKKSSRRLPSFNRFYELARAAFENKDGQSEEKSLLLDIAFHLQETELQQNAL